MATRAATLRLPDRRRAAAAPRFGIGALLAACLALAVVSLLAPSSPTYDPWAWLVWGREVAHLDLDTNFGPSWKPLPVALTTLFSFFPGAAPSLWVVVARTGGLAALAMTFRVVRRLGGGLAGGVIAAVSLALVSNFLRFAAVGDSEGLLVVLLLLGIDLHLSGRRRAALWAGFAAALLRPESWLFVGAYAVWLAWRDPAVRKLVAGLAVATLALWFVPELLGSGNALRAGQRAHDPNPTSLAFKSFPAWEVIKLAISMTPLVALVGVLVAFWMRPLRLLAAVSVVWLLEVAIMTQVGFSGNARYLIAPIGLACVAGGAALGQLVHRLGPRWAIAVTIAAVVPFVALRVTDLRTQATLVGNEAALMKDLSAVVRASGGPGAARSCGSITTGPYQVTALAWRLNVHIERIGLNAVAPGVVFRAAPQPRQTPKAPLLAAPEPAFRPVARTATWQALSTC